MKLPLVDLKAQYRSIRPEIRKAVSKVLESQQFLMGLALERFERQFARYLGVRHCVGMDSGTGGLWLMLWACGIKAGDEVITTPLTFFATAEAILLCGAKPVFVDVRPDTLNMDPDAVESAVTPRTRAILPVHLYGQAAEMDALQAIAQRKGLLLLEDAAQAAGSLYKGKKAGTLSLAATFSFYPGKNLGAYGDAGAVVTNDDAIARELRRLHNHGSERKNYHERLGLTARMDDLQAAVLSAKLPRLNAWNAARGRHVQAYRKALSQAEGLRFIEEIPESRSNYHLCVVRHPRRDELLACLRAQGILADIHYPVACHLQPALGAARMSEGSLPHAEKAAKEVLSLPLFPELSRAQILRVAQAVLDFCRG